MAYPLILAALTGYRLKSFEHAVVALEQGMKDGSILNKTFIDAKQGVNTALYYSFTQVVSEPFFYAGKYEEQSRKAYELYQGHPASANLVPGYLKKLLASGENSPAVQAMIALMREFLPLSEALNELKTKVVKRQPKPVEDKRAKYLAPPASTPAMTMVRNALIEITNQSFETLKGHLVSHYRFLLDKYLAAAAETGITTADYYNRRGSRTANIAGWEVVKVTTTDAYRGPSTELPNANEVIAQMAQKRAEEIRETFIIRNLEKLDSIIERKGDLARVTIGEREINLSGLNGQIVCIFADGARFTVQLQGVWVINSYGTEFVRFPVTFHHVIMSNGTQLKQPSEEKMNTVFVGRPLTQ